MESKKCTELSKGLSWIYFASRLPSQNTDFLERFLCNRSLKIERFSGALISNPKCYFMFRKAIPKRPGSTTDNENKTRKTPAFSWTLLEVKKFSAGCSADRTLQLGHFWFFEHLVEIHFLWPLRLKTLKKLVNFNEQFPTKINFSGVNVLQYEFNETNFQIAFYSAFERLWTFSLILWKRVKIKWIKNCKSKVTPM